jgi:uncharacterized protein (TIGR02145 family)
MRKKIHFSTSDFTGCQFLKKINSTLLTMKNALVIISIFILSFLGSTAENPKNKSTFQAFPNDIQSVAIKNQVWMKANLSIDSYRNGESIPEAKSEAEWLKFAEEKQGCWSYPEYKSSNNGLGRIYNYYAASDPRGLIPAGWHIPSQSEWNELLNTLGGAEKAGKQLKSKSGWNDDNNGSDKSGFNARPAGSFGYNGIFDQVGSSAIWWSSTTPNNESVITFSLSSMDNEFEKYKTHKGNGCSIRCIRD